MFSGELRELLLRVLTSWQVIAVTVAVFFYFFLVSSAARTRRSRAASFSSKPKKKKKDRAKAVSEDGEAETMEETEEAVNEELGIEG